MYKGYAANIRIDPETGIHHGEVRGIRDVVTFEGASVEEVGQAFRDSVDDYLAFCEERGENPDPPGGTAIRMSDRDRDTFLEMLDDPPDPNAALVRAGERYMQMVDAGDIEAADAALAESDERIPYE